ncbi:MAG: nucleotidyltransferase domain-containing protein [Candidatus Marsarchaeota archaeon]|nr:nucleotidyltransferase domain-containing protein [Candidatus Marsarchaeota archaeon]MCL5106143.1 nucleotidyltransferase domain-containing protein [Candidatus Marsarchaeota archaeon]
MGNYKQMLVDEKAHAELDSAKKMLSSRLGTRLSYKDVIEEFIGRKMRFLRLPKELRDYINRFVSDAAMNKHVQGILLFGSVAKMSFSKYSDTDLLIVADDTGIADFEFIEGLIKGAERYREPLIAEGFNLRISPLLLHENELSSFRPVYIDFLEQGAVLFERNEVLTNFLDSIKRDVHYEKRIVNDTVVVKWSIKG